jgi:hypothetical protein
MNGLVPQRDLGLSNGDVRPVQESAALEAPERRVTQNREAATDTPDQKYRQPNRQNDSIEISQEAIDLSQVETRKGELVAGQALPNSQGLSDAVSKLTANEVLREPSTAFGNLNPELPPLPFRSIHEGADLSIPAQEGTGNLS